MAAPLIVAGIAARAVAKKVVKEVAKKSSKKVIKAATKKNTGKMNAVKRGFEKDKASRKEMKQQDIFYNKAGKADLKEGQVTGASKANVSVSRSVSKPKVPIKKRGK
jgi:hypothetical protein